MSAGALLDAFLRGDAALVTATDIVPELRACAANGVMNAVALATAPERRAEVKAFLASAPDFRLIGPNCAGVFSAATGAVLTTSARLLPEPIAGGACLVSQSGGIGVGLLHALLKRGAGFAHFISTGDELDLGAIRIAAALLEEPACTVLGLFLEGLTDPTFMPELRAAIERTRKPVLAVRTGTSAGGRAAAFGHTGRIVGDATIARTVLEQTGVRILESVEELCDVLTVLSVLPPRAESGPLRVGVVVTAGGLGVVAADEIAHAGNLQLAEPPWDLASVLAEKRVPFTCALRELGGRCNAIVAVVTTFADEYERIAADDYRDLPPLVLSHLSPEERFTPEQARRLAAAGIASIPSVRNAVRALAAWAGPTGPTAEAGSQYRRRGLIRSQLLGRWLAPTIVVESADEAVAAAKRLGGAVAVKAEGTEVEHRHEVGVVHTHLREPDEIRTAYVAVARHDQVVVQAMAPRGSKLLVSIVRDPELGPVALYRPEGGATRVLTEDIPPPLRELVAEMLAAVRGDDEIIGIECNPVIVHEHGATVVDLLTYRR